MKYKIINNFLDLDQFNKVRSYVLDKEFPWRRVDDMNWNEKGRLFFTHCFFTDSEITSPGFEPYIKPILKKLNSIAVIKARANMFVSKLFTKSDLHIDYETGVKIGNKIKFIQAEANKILIFDMGVQHRAVTSKETPVRYIINLNYYEDKI